MKPMRSIAVLLVLASFLAACDDGSQPDNATPDRGQRSPSPNVARTDAVAEEREDLTGKKQEAATFRPRISFKAPTGGERLRVGRETRDLLLIDGGRGFRIVFSNPAEVFTYETGRPRLVDAPADLMAWVRSIPHLEVTGEGSVRSLPGKPAFIDTMVTSVEKRSDKLCVIPCVPLVSLEAGDRSVFVVDHQRARFLFYDEMFVLVSGPDRGFGKTSRRAEKLLRTLEF